jgi:hypothetical protein
VFGELKVSTRTQSWQTEQESIGTPPEHCQRSRSAERRPGAYPIQGSLHDRGRGQPPGRHSCIAGVKKGENSKVGFNGKPL